MEVTKGISGAGTKWAPYNRIRMYAISNAFFFQAEIVQKDRWSQGPLEIAFVKASGAPPLSDDRLKLELALHTWNQTYAAGQIRPGDAFEVVAANVPSIKHRRNPNLFFATCTSAGVTELHVMLASLLPSSLLRKAGLKRSRANMALALHCRHDLPASYASRVEHSFAQYIWSKVEPGGRAHPAFFSPQSPLRILAGDVRFWMQRIYRIALERRETWFEPTSSEDPDWRSMDELQAIFDEGVPADERDQYEIRRPLMGGTIWDETDAREREAVLEEAIAGAGVMKSLDPVIELLRRQRAHEDFSSRASWIREDFERSFYSKRAKLKVELVETVDDAPVWNADECDGYGDVLFRDVFAALDAKERKLYLALRSGKSQATIARGEGLSGHAAVSRRVERLKAKIRALLADA